MKISKIFKLNKTQAQLDFIDIDIDKDTPLFIDPFFISQREDNWSIEVNKTIKSFFQKALNHIKNNQIPEGKALFKHLHEPNATCLGLSKGTPQGRGVGLINTDDIFNNILESRAVKTGLIKDLEDNILFVNGFGKDKLSDMTTNIIMKHLIEYTQKQCELHNIELSENVSSGFFWSRQACKWEQSYTKMLVVEKKIILVPKGIVSFCEDYTPIEYYNSFVLNFMQSEQLELNSSLVQKRKDGTKFVTKKDLKKTNHFSKDFITDFSESHPDILENFRKSTKTISLKNKDISEIDMKDLCNFLINELKNIPKGPENATKFHRTITGILEIIFYPNLIYPVLECEIHQGRKRIDLTFDNAAIYGIFYRLSHSMGIPCQYIMIECKNYSSDIANPELDQISGRFSTNRGKVGFIICRSIDKFDLFLDRCKDTYKDDRGLIMPITDMDLIELLDSYDENDLTYSDEFFSDRIRKICAS
ncbi:MAG: hypothetical protein PHR82_08460 [Endomicrobiaceae bacterium]|nr:hypothetical protein [Endomicrobiaceae bacterium]